MDSVRSSSPLFSDSDRLELPSLAQGNLISFDPEEESRNKTSGSQDRVVSNSPGIPCAQTVQDNLSQGIQTSPVMEASPVQHTQESVRTNRGYGSSVSVSSGTFIPCRERFYPSRQGNPVNRSSGTRLGYRRGFDCTGYVVEDPLLDPYVEFEGQGSGGHNGEFVVQGQGPSNYSVRDRNTVERETNKHPVGSNPSGLGGIESRVST